MATGTLFLLAGRYTLLEQQSLTTLFPLLERAGTTIIVGGPFNSGILAGRDTFNYARAPEAIVERVKKIAAVCDAHGVALGSAALAFPLGSPQVTSVIPGGRARWPRPIRSPTGSPPTFPLRSGATSRPRD